MIKIWTEALRSGKYKQGKSLINKKEETVCVLAVLAMELDYLTYDGYHSERHHRDFATLVMNLIGSEMMRDIVHSNDREGMTFSQAADILDGLAA